VFLYVVSLKIAPRGMAMEGQVFEASKVKENANRPTRFFVAALCYCTSCSRGTDTYNSW